MTYALGMRFWLCLNLCFMWEANPLQAYVLARPFGTKRSQGLCFGIYRVTEVGRRSGRQNGGQGLCWNARTHASLRVGQGVYEGIGREKATSGILRGLLICCLHLGAQREGHVIFLFSFETESYVAVLASDLLCNWVWPWVAEHLRCAIRCWYFRRKPQAVEGSDHENRCWGLTRAV